MLTGELKSKIDQIWNAFWSGGIANPIEVIEQITYLLFLRGLDTDQTQEESKATRLKANPVRIYPDGADAKGRSFEDLRWSRFKDFAPSEMFTVLSEHVFPFLRSLNEPGMRIALPPFTLQQTFAARSQAIEALKATRRAALAELNALFASLQQRAFIGAL